MEYRSLVWFNPDLKKGDHHYVGYLCIHSTTQPLHQGGGNAEKTKPEESFTKVDHKVVGSIPREDIAFSIFNLKIMFELWTSAICVIVIVIVAVLRGW